MYPPHSKLSPGDYVLGWADTFEPGKFPICRVDENGHTFVVASASTRTAAVEQTKAMAAADHTCAWLFVEPHTYEPL
jgi:hypothetical protein